MVNLGMYDHGDDIEAQRKEQKTDAQAMAVIQQGVHDTLFSRIASAETSQEAWDTLRMEFQGDSQVQAIKLQGLRREFENLVMKEGEVVGDYFSCVMAIVSQQRAFGEEVPYQKIVEKILRSLTAKFDYVVPSIEVAYDLTRLSPVKLMGSLQSQEERLNSRSGELKIGDKEKSNEQALQVYQPNRRLTYDQGSRGRGRGTSRGRGRGCSNEDRGRGPQCYQYNRFGHLKRDCWFNEESQAKVAANPEEEEENHEEVPYLFMALTTCDSDNPSLWFIDSGCSNHMTSVKGSFVKLDDSFKLAVKLGDKKTLLVEGKGTIKIKMNNGTFKYLDNLMRKGYALIFDDDACSIIHKETQSELMKVQLAANNMFPLDASKVKASGSSHEHEATRLWHCRFGHLHSQALQQLYNKKMVQGLPRMKEIGQCEGCASGKLHKLPFHSSTRRATQVLEVIHTDVCGPMPVKSLGGSRYFLLFIDDFSRMTWVYFIEKKSEVFSKFKVFKDLVEKQCEKFVKVLRSDRGGEYCSNEFNSFCELHGIKRQLTAPHTPQQNGVCERKNRTVVEMAQCLLQSKGMPSYFWAEAISTAVHILNMSPTKAVDARTPIEVWSGEKPDVEDLRVFGSITYGLTPAQLKHKFEPTSTKCILIGYFSRVKTPKNSHLWDLSTLDMLLGLTNDLSTPSDSQNQQTTIPNVTAGQNSHDTSNQDVISQHHSTEGSQSQTVGDAAEGIVDSNSPPLRTRSLNDVYEATSPMEDYLVCEFALSISDPMMYEEVILKKEWQVAMTEEIKAIEKNETWMLVDPPSNRNIVGLKWLYKTKLGPDGKMLKYKARLVLKGYSQRKGVDFQDTFAPVARFETIRTVLAAAAHQGWMIFQLDVKSAFLNGRLEEEIYVEQPKGFEVKGQENKVYRLHKALYGLKQAPRAWYSRIDTYFTGHGFARSNNEPTLYVKTVKEVGIIYVCLYVDDIIYTSSSAVLLQEFKEGMMQEFEMTDMGHLKFFLGLEVIQMKTGVFVNQAKYAEDLLRKFEMVGCKIEDTPMNANEKLHANDESAPADAVLYRSLIGGLMYLQHTRPDISFTVNVLSRFMQRPSKLHFGAARRVLGYVAGTVRFGLWYEKNREVNLYGYSDSDWAGSLDDRKSISANVFTLGSGVVSWSSKKQHSIALSSTKAEYISATSATCQAIWLRRILEDLGLKQERATVIWCDSRSAIHMSRNPVMNGRSKHIELKHHFIRDMVAQRQVSLEFCGTDEQIADVLTKALCREKFMLFRRMLGVREFELKEGVEE
ncbi:putative RNA-directed DNA polymerase [Helianthus annuus]|nr:putative RNA-directed DNA polymerase [Helianthus annuus]